MSMHFIDDETDANGVHRTRHGMYITEPTRFADLMVLAHDGAKVEMPPGGFVVAKTALLADILIAGAKITWPWTEVSE